MEKKINIGSSGKVNIKWRVLPIDYTHDTEENIRVKFARKYGIPKESVKVEPVFITKDKNGNTKEYQNDITSNIQNPEFQRNLFKEYLNERGITDYEFDKIVDIDNEINNHINYTLYDQNKRYSINWIKWDNFMSYGSGNYFDFRTVNGLVLLTSEPANQGGKTTFCLDLLRFLLFGKVTSRENDWVLSRVFNKHLPDATEVIVEGCITIDGVDYVIKRTITRPALKKRTEKSKVTQKVDYYKLVNGEYIDLTDEDCENEITVTETNKAIKDAIGNERDFDLMICVDADNLKDLISLKDTDRGRLISRWIGLLSLEDKDKIARDKYNKEILPNLTLTRCGKSKEEIRDDVNELKVQNKDLSERIAEDLKKQEESNGKLSEFRQTKDALLSSKQQIDENLLKVDVVTLETTLQRIKEDGTNKRAELKENKNKLDSIGNVEFSEDEYKTLRAEEKRVNEMMTQANVRHMRKKSDIEALKKGEYCPTCGAKLANVDNSAKILEAEKESEIALSEYSGYKSESDRLSKKIALMDDVRIKYNDKCKLQLMVAKNEVDIDNLLSRYRECQRQIDDINRNKSAIENNNKIENSINVVNNNIKVEENYLQAISKEITQLNTSVEYNLKTIKQCENTIKTIENEEVLIKNWRIYLDMIGKNGISKMVIRAVLPLINGELKHLLSDVCDFDVEVSIDEHNDVAFSLIHDGVKSALGSGSGFEQTVSSLALRTVLSKISSFSKPSFVVFDEILGGVAAENYDALKRLYDKMVSSYGTILEITHNPALVEWHKYFITVKKENNISSIKKCS